ncbi:phage tail terminator-like protein [Stenotrophomonas sp.]|uniref:phage tail terminator-like protein n=1 Tax=Stenotrophomonas sp. TaxID=69392 RepID=UPI0028A93BF7|nr:phage tail terminator-like protein [Stenotrophomonas sp.]
MSNKLCRQVIESRLAAWAAAQTPALPVAWQNVRFTEPAGTYLRAFLLPADTGSDDLAGVHRLYRGVYQINVCAPINAGPGEAEKVAAELAALFPNNLQLPATDLTLQVISPVSAGASAQPEDRYVLPVSFRYRADVT